ncbi:hypothetical protein DPMN_175906 [Dreissena polymorpha]|uniref:Uncharacterized protein n=1 Tax=Dreissena polymorpha TaxID=45954 RepID=A0A9D4E8Z7_DREPO|nr:hypothetical protein DPMN_175906 [Dreissena polymorpha]
MFMTITCIAYRYILVDLVHKCSSESVLVQSSTRGYIQVPLVMSNSSTIMW